VKISNAVLLLALLCCLECQSQTKKEMKDDKANPLLCDPATGMCEMQEQAGTTAQVSITPVTKPVKIIYYTDPICSSCWGIEPQLRKLKLEYGDYVEIEYRMGGLLPDWSYNSGGISKPADVAHHWDEASAHYEMPIDGDVWLEDPLDSSYPSCIAVKAAQLQDKQKAVQFMRILREMLYLDKKNIAKWQYINEAATLAGLNTEKLKKDYEGPAKKLFEEDLEMARNLGVRGFPTLFFSDGSGNQLKVYGSKQYDAYENALKATFPGAKKKPVGSDSVLELFTMYPTLAIKEAAVILGITTANARTLLDAEHSKGNLDMKNSKNGILYIKKQKN